MPLPLPYFKVNICPFPLPHFASIFFAYLWSFRWPNYIVTLPRYFSFRLPHLNINTGLPLRRIGQEYSAKVAFSIFQSLKRIQRRGHIFFEWNKCLWARWLCIYTRRKLYLKPGYSCSSQSCFNLEIWHCINLACNSHKCSRYILEF